MPRAVRHQVDPARGLARANEGLWAWWAWAFTRTATLEAGPRTSQTLAGIHARPRWSTSKQTGHTDSVGYSVSPLVTSKKLRTKNDAAGVTEQAPRRPMMRRPTNTAVSAEYTHVVPCMMTSCTGKVKGEGPTGKVGHGKDGAHIGFERAAPRLDNGRAAPRPMSALSFLPCAAWLRGSIHRTWR